MKQKDTRISFLILVAFFTSLSSFGQSPFSIELEPLEIDGLGGVQSYSYAQHEGKWLIVGGRLDGLHRGQPWASFDLAGHNDQLIVVDPESAEVWYGDISNFTTEQRSHLSSSNMEFYREGDFLYLIGGYGYSSSQEDHITFPYITAINVPLSINAVIDGSDLLPNFRQYYDEELAVTGGRLLKINDVFHLVTGHRFDGRYNPMDHPTFVQEYHEQIKRFEIEDDGENLVLEMHDPLIDSENLHRRDLNVAPQIFPNGEEGFTIFSGVFQEESDIPFLNSVNVNSQGYTVNNDFSQYYNHYHCAHVPLYSAEQNEMHTVFFGGIAQYFEEQGELVQDNEVPFVKTIARVTRDAEGAMIEYKLPIEMPAYLGAGSEFIPYEGLISFSNGVLDLDAFDTGQHLIGYIYGGIESTEKNIFWINDGTQSSASSTIYKVYLSNLNTSLDELNEQSVGPMRIQLYPNPYIGLLFVDLHLSQLSDVNFTLYDATGKAVYDKTVTKEE